MVSFSISQALISNEASLPSGVILRDPCPPVIPMASGRSRAST